LKEQTRDEHGIEAVDGLFSSPGKSTRQDLENDENQVEKEQEEEDDEPDALGM
jgi:hypothetical protein